VCGEEDFGGEAGLDLYEARGGETHTSAKIVEVKEENFHEKKRVLLQF